MGESGGIEPGLFGASSTRKYSCPGFNLNVASNPASSQRNRKVPQVARWTLLDSLFPLRFRAQKQALSRGAAKEMSAMFGDRG
jgi:hypothetical protein